MLLNKDYVDRYAKQQVSDVFRMIRTNLYCCMEGKAGYNTIMVTSALAGEGKSTVAVNTAMAYAQLGKTVLIVDCNLHRPIQDKLLMKCQKNDRKLGISDVLREGIPPETVIHDTDIKNVKFIASGTRIYHPCEILASTRMESVLTLLKRTADIVFIDTPAVNCATDACVLAAKADGILLVVNAKMAHPKSVCYAKEALLQANGRLLGVVLNQAGYG